MSRVSEETSVEQSLAHIPCSAPVTRPGRIHRAAHFLDDKLHRDSVPQPLEQFSEETLAQADVTTLSEETSETSLNPAHLIATKAELEAVQQKHPLPVGAQDRAFWDDVRYRLFSTYRRLFTLIFALNSTALVVFLAPLSHSSHFPAAKSRTAATAAAANFSVSVLLRNEHVLNGLFRIACSLPVTSPLWMRRYAAKVYCYGGVHSGCGVSGTMWYLTFCGLVYKQFASTRRSGVGLRWYEWALVCTTAIVVLLLTFILAFAHPRVRAKIHNHFEKMHRYAGWTAIACLWLQLIASAVATSKSSHRSCGTVLIRTPSFWFLVVITLCFIYPWTRVRLRTVQVEKLSDHATRLHFDYLDKIETCQAVRLTHNPFKETHAFATIPNDDGEKGFSALVSNAGDWTDDVIRSPRRRIFVKGAPTLGLIRISLLFKKILLIATGSGIGPCLSLLQTPPKDLPRRRPEMRVIWSTNAPLTTYRKNIVESVFRADRNAIIVDTKQTGRGNLLALSYGQFIESGAEAAVVISNPTVTAKVVHGLEVCGVPAFGAIFDS